ncbi:hypothetical protein Alsa2_CDS0232 [Staphylococcus phage Alsa_2]|nr:hypothetical protein Alsa2_CDS0232 [Staphylococcus phage Alsa_2]
MARKSTKKQVDLSDKSYAHIDTFINTAKIHFGMSDAQALDLKHLCMVSFISIMKKILFLI